MKSGLWRKERFVIVKGHNAPSGKVGQFLFPDICDCYTDSHLKY